MIRLNGEKLMRYDLNRTVEVVPRRGNELYEVLFSKGVIFEDMRVSTREEGGKTVAEIPNIMLQGLGTVVCRIVSLDKHGHLDYEDASFVIHDRAKPDDYEFEDNAPKGSSGGGLPSVSAPHQMLVTDADGKTVWEERPFYKTSKWERPANVMYGQEVVTEAFKVTTAYDEELGFATGNHDFLLVPLSSMCRVVFDGDMYEMKSKLFGDRYYLGSDPSSGAFDFSEYPFCIMSGMIATKGAGEHTVDLFFYSETIETNYGPSPIYILSDTDSNGNPCFSREDMERVADAYRFGVPVNLDIWGLKAVVYEVEVDLVYARTSRLISPRCVEMCIYRFRVEDGVLHDKYKYIAGSDEENGNYYPLMYINNRYYKITVGSDGALKATECTG